MYNDNMKAMRGSISIVMMMVLLSALGAGLVLVKSNTETRKGAYFAGSKVLLQPTAIDKKVGEPVAIGLYVDSGMTTGIYGENAKVDFIKTQLCFGKELNIVADIGNTANVKLNQVAFDEILELGVTDISATQRCLLLAVKATKDESNLMSGMIQVASIRLTAESVGKGSININQSLTQVSGPNPNDASTDMSLSIDSVAGADYNISLVQVPTATVTPMPTCVPRPACLDEVPPCMISEPAGGWCPVISTPTPTKVMIPTATRTMTPTKSPIPTATRTPTLIMTKTPTPTATKTPSPSFTPTATKTPTVTPTLAPCQQPSGRPDGCACIINNQCLHVCIAGVCGVLPTSTPTRTPTPTVTRTPTPSPTNTPVPPTLTPTKTPTPVVGETSLKLLPATGSYEVGETIVMMVEINTGGVSNKLDGFDIRLNFEPTKVGFSGIEMLNGYQLINGGGAENLGVITDNIIRLSAVSMGGSGGGVITVAKITLVAKVAGDTVISYNGGILLINLTNEWPVKSSSGAKYTIVGVTVTPTNTPPVARCRTCPSEFYCYVSTTGEHRWFVTGYVQGGFVRETVANSTVCGGVVKPTYVGKTGGDANCDGSVDGADYSVWRREYLDICKTEPIESATWEADFNCDSKVDGYDYSLWRRGYN